MRFTISAASGGLPGAIQREYGHCSFIRDGVIVEKWLAVELGSLSDLMQLIRDVREWIVVSTDRKGNGIDGHITIYDHYLE